MSGWMGKLLKICLSDGKVETERPEPDIYRKYIGGRGLGAYLLARDIDPQVEPLSPANPLIFTVGPLTGTRVPTSGRFSLSTKSPLTGTICDSNAGGVWGVKFKRCGYDGLIVSGRAERPVYIVIKNGSVQIKDATEIWGKTTRETTDWLKAREGQEVSVACIGPAGENQIRFAAIINDYSRALGRGGVGAVMGAKNLKAIVVRGESQIPVAEQEKLENAIYDTMKWLKANPITSQGLPEFGTAVLVNLINEVGILPTKNFQQSQFDEAEAISGEELAEKLTVKRSGCYACPIKCSRVTRVGEQTGEGPEFETIWAFGAQCGIADLELITRANYLCNELGLDTISTGNTIGCAMELAEKGHLTVKLGFGKTDQLLELVEKIAYRQGLGTELAEGSKSLAEKYGAPELAMQVKGLEMPAYDPRGAQGMGLALATSNRGACHMRAYMIGPEVLGVPKLVDPHSPAGKAGLTINAQNINAAMDTLVLCRFIGLAVSEEYFARLLTHVTGVNYQAQELHLIGERIWNLERMFNLRAGLSALDDTLPLRMLHEPVLSGPAAGQVVELDKMLREYYLYRGWDKNGTPTPAKLKQLGLEELDRA